MQEHYAEHFTLMSHDIDINGNVRPSIISRLMGETANHHMRDRRPTYYELFDEGKSFIATRMAFELRAQLKRYDEVEVRTWYCPGKAATWVRCFTIERGGETVARAYSEWAVADRLRGGLCRVSEIDMSNYESDEPLRMKVPVRFRFPADAAFEKCGEKTVVYSEVDMNLHMNNTYYQDMIWNCVPGVEHRKVTSFSLRFMAEAPLGHDIEIWRAPMEKTLNDGCGAEESWYFRTLVDGRTNTESIVCAAHAEPDDRWDI